ncbi:MAG: SPFH domain-containing protein [Candidatus Aminicenantes bacterium]|nr:SPFH domain-containing protein [Candidatus Aminicenantes bacterium]
MKNIQEKKVFKISGWAVLAVDIILVAFAVSYFIRVDDPPLNFAFFARIGCMLIVGLTGPGFFVLHPNEALVFTFVGRYFGSARDAGFHWTNPFCAKHRVTLRISNLISEKIKVNDACGNPIEIAAVVVWHVVDTAKAKFNVDNYKNFIAIQSETAVRQLASHYPYDSHEADQESLRTNPDQIAAMLRDQVQERLEVSGVNVVEARLMHLAYAPEIAQAMLRRQQAEAIIAARQKIVDGAVGMVEMALVHLEKSGMVDLDNEKKAAMVNNLLVALVSENDATPVINTGTLYA